MYVGIVLASPKWIDKCLKKKCTVFYITGGISPRDVRGLKGSICLILAGTTSSMSRWYFIGEFTVNKVKRVKPKEFEELYASKAVTVGKVKPPKSRSFWIMEFDKLIRYEKPIRLENVNIITRTGKPLSESKIKERGFTLIKPENASDVLNAIRCMSGAMLEARPLNHSELVKELLEIGEWLDFVVKKEEYIDKSHTYRVDVTWRVAEGRNPLKVFEIVKPKGDVDKALERLAHARQVWHSNQLWLVIGDESGVERALKLLEPSGLYAKLRKYVKIKSWKDIHELYRCLELHKKTLEELSKR